MVFLGADFFSDSSSMDNTVIYPEQLNKITLRNGIYDNMFVTKNTDMVINPDESQTWDYETIIDAKFDGTLTAGNLQYTVDQVSSIRVKYRESGSFDWITCFEIPVSSEEDFLFTRELKYLKSGTKYDIAIVPVLNGVEGNFNIKSVDSEFDGMFVLDKDNVYSAPLNVGIYPVTQNKNSNTISTLNNKYPFVIYNGKANYKSGSAIGLFVGYGDSVEYDFDNDLQYRENVLEFLTNGKPKILKTYHGYLFIINVIDTISVDRDSHDKNVNISFSWVECGDSTKSQDLYNNNFIDILTEGGEQQYVL